MPVVLVAALVLLPITPAEASLPQRGPVPSNAFCAGVALKGMSEAEARSAISSAVRVPALAPIYVRSGDATLAYQPAAALVVDVDAILAKAYAVRSDDKAYAIAPVFTVNASVVAKWTDAAAKRLNRSAHNAKYAVKRTSLIVVNPVYGRALLRGYTRRLVSAAVRASLVATSGVPAVQLPFVATTPSVTLANLGKAILITKHLFTVRLYRGRKVEHHYRCAVGQARYPTPTGVFKVVGKVKYPSWHNPHDAWSAGMPEVIGPGPNNPLGLAAIYLSAPGIRIHGVPASELGSIGSPASHGCIRLSNHDALDLYPRVSVGIPVFIIK